MSTTIKPESPDGNNHTIDSLYFTNGKITAVHLADQKVDTFVAFSDIASSTSNWTLNVANADADVLPLLTASDNTVWTNTANGSTSYTTSAGITVNPSTITTKDGVLSSVTTTVGGTTYSIKGSDLATDLSSTDNTENTNIGNVTVTPNYVSGAQIYSDKALSAPIAGSYVAYGTTKSAVAELTTLPVKLLVTSLLIANMSKLPMLLSRQLH
ncbi:hypothetical protein FC83_GL002106 [Agrilactobacillus composti DSM 18527 = JCM 14202]|uniref:Uncharacterized protein n=1 Tax=Agrilactobacillus composti DSM 18527 = JCM 14202 TaxID=1423734 RepID=X0PWM9_9LACO|nr:hypothetical protein [Agrilactobacillus composti]KRM34767.1 hypothetical protein FC83_GL002106 [Agrilactobacillus composti DSM 18527 = JCM 14202]GAF41961.1 hypothetical protein JCM14202_3936 [Agrilactobacillus composti DSM 18527 = JCM 14202]